MPDEIGEGDHPARKEAAACQEAAKKETATFLPQPTEAEKESSNKRPRGSIVRGKDRPLDFSEENGQASQHFQPPAAGRPLADGARVREEAVTAGPPLTRSYSRRKREKVQSSGSAPERSGDSDLHRRDEPLGAAGDERSCHASADTNTGVALAEGGREAETSSLLANPDTRVDGACKEREVQGRGSDLLGNPFEQSDELLLQQVLDSLFDGHEAPAEDGVMPAPFCGQAPAEPQQERPSSQQRPFLGDQSSSDSDGSRSQVHRQSMSPPSVHVGGVGSALEEEKGWPQQALSKTSEGDEEEEAAQLLIGRTPATADHGIVHQVCNLLACSVAQDT